MFIHHDTQKEFRRNCREYSLVDSYSMCESLETNDDNYNIKLYERIENDMVSWAEQHIVGDAFYSGDLNFEFELKSDRDLFDKEFGDQVAFKLKFA